MFLVTNIDSIIINNIISIITITTAYCCCSTAYNKYIIVSLCIYFATFSYLLPFHVPHIIGISVQSNNHINFLDDPAFLRRQYKSVKEKWFVRKKEKLLCRNFARSTKVVWKVLACLKRFFFSVITVKRDVSVLIYTIIYLFCKLRFRFMCRGTCSYRY